MPVPTDPAPRHPVRLCLHRETFGGERERRAVELAEALGLPVTGPGPVGADYDAALVETGRRLELRVLRGDRALTGGHGVAGELACIDTHSGPGRSLNQPLLKAVGIKRKNPDRPAVFDATAGLGEDAWVLASFGCRVTACERNPAVHALLCDALERAAGTHPDTAERLTVIHGDSASTLAESDKGRRPDVVYLDPMFPPGRKTAERKAMRVLRLLAGDDPDADRLLAVALQAARRRVVVKRPRHAAPIPGPEPDVVHKGKSLRFDVYLTR